MNKVLLLKCGEIVLKGLNRRSFEEKLLKNIKHSLNGFGSYKIKFAQSTIFIFAGDNFDVDGAFLAVQKVFGLASVCMAHTCEKNIDDIIKTAETSFEKVLSEAVSFKVEAKRADKKFPLTTPEIARIIGEKILLKYPHLKVSMTEPQIRLTVEVRDFGAYVHTDKLQGARGIPIGMGGRATLLLSGGIDSPVAGYMLAKRGVELSLVHFFSYPYTSEMAKQKVIDLAKIMAQYCGNMTLFIVPFTKIQEAIRDNCKDDLFTIIMRRFMMQISQKIAENAGSISLITGESLGQVASQTMQAIAATDAVCNIPVFRPLIGMDKEEIIKISRKMGAFETSILPYEDCCTVFTPKHPQTKPKIHEIEQEEALLPIDDLITNAIENVERVEIS